MAKPAPTFWITNLCNRNVSLADLNLTVPAFRSINLLDKRHYSYTMEQLEKSAENGSLFHKRDKLSVRQVPPTIIKVNMPFLEETYIPSRERSILSIKETHYEELDLPEEQKKKEEQFADESSDMEIDVQPPTNTKG
jgi:hypothetical protein